MEFACLFEVLVWISCPVLLYKECPRYVRHKIGWRMGDIDTDIYEDIELGKKRREREKEKKMDLLKDLCSKA